MTISYFRPHKRLTKNDLTTLEFLLETQVKCEYSQNLHFKKLILNFYTCTNHYSSIMISTVIIV